MLSERKSGKKSIYYFVFCAIIIVGRSFIPNYGYAFSTEQYINPANGRVAPHKAVPASNPFFKYVAIGNSITAGVGDDYDADNTSVDGRNTGGGFEPILNDLLTFAKGISHSVVNAGVPGSTSENGLASIHSILASHGDAYGFLIMYGTNDARPWHHIPPGPGPGSFQDNMQQIINAITAAGIKVWIAKPPIALGQSVNSAPYPYPDNGERSLNIKEYIHIIENALNGITLPCPDFYTYFNTIDPQTGRYRYLDQYADNLHPNGNGYRAMAQVWYNILMQAPSLNAPTNLRIGNNLSTTKILQGQIQR
ncbi:MAG: SGNH/GDSL hydrolase family protein [Desulfobacterales bacterium]|nr:SGNH/GDSL hydrolase family protein [Desulfobacterales bacterium]